MHISLSEITKANYKLKKSGCRLYWTLYQVSGVAPYYCGVSLTLQSHDDLKAIYFDFHEVKGSPFHWLNFEKTIAHLFPFGSRDNLVDLALWKENEKL